MAEKTIVLATNNAGKVHEISGLVQGLPYRFLCLADVFEKPPVIEETGTTFIDNARIKAEYIYDQTGLWALADDSGLQVDYLHGGPGVYSARYAGENATQQMLCHKLLTEMRACRHDLRTARFCCAMVLKFAPHGDMTVEGACEGSIGFTMMGDQGFGYDPLFFPTGYKQTFAQLDMATKNKLSHRGKALLQIKKVLNDKIAAE